MINRFLKLVSSHFRGERGFGKFAIYKKKEEQHHIVYLLHYVADLEPSKLLNYGTCQKKVILFHCSYS